MDKPTYEELEARVKAQESHIETMMHYLKQISTNVEASQRDITIEQLRFKLEIIGRTVNALIGTMSKADKQGA